MDITLVVDALEPQLSGIGHYTWELCQRLPHQRGIESVGFFARGQFIDDPYSLRAGKEPQCRSILPRWLKRRRTRGRLRASLVHGPNYFLPPDCEKGIITVHDLSVFRHPDTHPAERLHEFEQKFESSLRRAAHAITDCETIRRELIEDFGVAETSVTAIPLGIGSEFRPQTEDEIAWQLASLGLQSGGYALCVSTLEPRKKIGQLLSAWRALPLAIRSSRPLVLAGAEGWLNDRLHEQIRDGVAEGWLQHLGFVAEPILPALYSGASLFLYPSIYEGFGLPPLEAMASGVPAIVANCSCLPEVCGDAAAYVDPDDISGFTSMICDGLTDLEWRESARAKGLAKAATYGWDACVERTVAVYRAHCELN